MQTTLMKSILCAGLFSVGLGGAALAMPSADMRGASAPPVTRIDYACGRGWHLNDWNECVRNRWHRPPPRWVRRGPPPPWMDEPRGHWRHHHRPPPPDWGWD